MARGGMAVVGVALALSWPQQDGFGAAAAHEVDAAGGYVAPRGPGGEHPDLNGIWQALNAAHHDIELHMSRASVALRDGPHGPVPSLETYKLGAVAAVPPGMGVVEGGKLPYKPEALAKKLANQADWINLDPEVKCYLPGVPRATYMPQPFQIFQGEGDLFIAYQWKGAVRDIFTEDPGPAPIDSWMGQSVAHWEGDTLVIEVTGLNDQTWFDRAGNHHSAAMTVTERYTPTSPDHLLYEALIDDPETFERPWKMAMPLYRRQEASIQLMDFRCVEFVEELMYGEWRRTPLER